MANRRAAARLGVLLAGLAAASPAAAQWGQFRGPNGSGVDAATGYPAAFSPTSRMVWKAAVPFARSSPVIAGSRVYLTASEGDQLLMIAFDATGGRELWRRSIRRPRAQQIYKANDPASPTPAADEHGVVVFFADVGLVAYAPDGVERWRQPLGPFKNFYGMAGSPIITGWWMPLSSQGAIGTAVAHRETVIVATLAGNEPWMEPFESALKTFDTDKDGKLSRAEYAIEKGMGEHFGWVDADDDGVLDAVEYDDARAMGVGEYGIAALEPAGLSGKVDPSAALWRFKRNLPFVPTPVVYDGLLYMVKAGGIVTAIDPATGQATKEGRSTDAPGLHGVTDRRRRQGVPGQRRRQDHGAEGGREWEVLGVNDLGDEIHATPALAGGRIYVRTRGTLYCFGSAKP